MLGHRSEDKNTEVGLIKPSTSFRGYLSGFYLWQRVLTDDEIAQAQKKSPPMDNQIITWESFNRFNSAGTVRKVTFSKCCRSI